MADHGKNPDGTGVHHTPHGEHPDHVELARLHTEGWFIGRAIREYHAYGHERLSALMTGITQGMERRGDHDD